jgi:hypothetical protein
MQADEPALPVPEVVKDEVMAHLRGIFPGYGVALMLVEPAGEYGDVLTNMNPAVLAGTIDNLRCLLLDVLKEEGIPDGPAH